LFGFKNGKVFHYRKDRVIVNHSSIADNVAPAADTATGLCAEGKAEFEHAAEDPTALTGPDGQRTSSHPSSADKVLLESSRAGVLLLVLLIGVWTAWKETWPFDPHLRNAFLGFEALWQVYVTTENPMDTDVWQRIDSSEHADGVTTLVAPKVYDGVTLVAYGESAVLIDMRGTVLHRWHFPQQELEAYGVTLKSSTPDTWPYWKPARVLPNGDLIAIVDRMHSTPEGLAMIKLDRESRPVWVYAHAVHHDFDIDRNGNIYVLDQEIRSTPLPNLPALVPPLIDEGVVVLSPDGNQIARYSIAEAFQRSEYRSLLNEFAQVNRDVWGDYLHSNNVDVVDAELAEAFEFLDEGQVLLSFREISTIAVLDLDERQIVWAARGQWHMQHDPDLLPNGNILVFDNQGDWGRGGGSRVIEFDPLSRQVVWQFPNRQGQTLNSAYRAGQQKLPNGNVLINDFYQNRLIEVTEDGRIVWEYRCPFRHAKRDNLKCRAMSARRFARSELPFLSSNGAFDSAIRTSSTE